MPTETQGTRPTDSELSRLLQSAEPPRSPSHVDEIILRQARDKAAEMKAPSTSTSAWLAPSAWVPALATLSIAVVAVSVTLQAPNDGSRLEPSDLEIAELAPQNSSNPTQVLALEESTVTNNAPTLEALNRTMQADTQVERERSFNDTQAPDAALTTPAAPTLDAATAASDLAAPGSIALAPQAGAGLAPGDSNASQRVARELQADSSAILLELDLTSAAAPTSSAVSASPNTVELRQEIALAEPRERALAGQSPATVDQSQQANSLALQATAQDQSAAVDDAEPTVATLLERPRSIEPSQPDSADSAQATATVATTAIAVSDAFDEVDIPPLLAFLEQIIGQADALAEVVVTGSSIRANAAASPRSVADPGSRQDADAQTDSAALTQRAQQLLDRYDALELAALSAADARYAAARVGFDEFQLPDSLAAAIEMLRRQAR